MQQDAIMHYLNHYPGIWLEDFREDILC